MTGADLHAEEIVLALAAIDDPTVEAEGYIEPSTYVCGLCGATAGAHEPSCPWRLAREYRDRR